MTYPFISNAGQQTTEASCFVSRYTDTLTLAADAATVAAYFDDHAAWFCRCAQPMVATPLGLDGYAITIGRFGALGYEVEPKIGLKLLPGVNGVYQIQTIAIPEQSLSSYEVDFRAVMQLNEVQSETDGGDTLFTNVEWILDLAVQVHLPGFIRALPASLIHKTGDRLVAKIVRQVAHNLHHKVKADFYQLILQGEYNFP